MGGNGSYSYFVSNTLGSYTKDRYKTVGMIGKTKVVAVTKGVRSKTPMNSFTSKMYYVTNPNHPERIEYIAFYNQRTHGISKTIDLVYDKDGNFVSAHTHRWQLNDKGEYWRKSHDGRNQFECTKTDNLYLKRALRYNEKHSKQ